MLKLFLILSLVAVPALISKAVAATTTTTTQYQTEQTRVINPPESVVIITDDSIRQSFDKAIDFNTDLDDDVSYTVKDGVVTLSGTVDTMDELKKAEALAYQIKGVSHVVNNLVTEQAGLKATYPDSAEIQNTTYVKTTEQSVR